MLFPNSWKKYWKISLVVGVNTHENIDLALFGHLVITSTTHDIFQYILPAIWESLIPKLKTELHFLKKVIHLSVKSCSVEKYICTIHNCI